MQTKQFLQPPVEILYKNQPLSEVAMEVRFKGEPVIESKRHEFYEDIRDTYCDVLVPAAAPGISPSMQHYRFQNPKDNSLIQLSINSLGYVQRTYLGSQNFIEESIKMYGLALKLFEMRTITRIGWRYMNLIPFIREDGKIPIDNLFTRNTVSFKFADLIYKNLDISTSFTIENANINFKLRSVAEQNNSENEAIILDIDAYLDETRNLNSKVKSIKESLKYLHTIARNIFESTITKEYRNYLKGESYD